MIYSNAGKAVSYTHLTGIGLAGYGIALLEAHLGSDHGIDLVDGLLIPVEQFQEEMCIRDSAYTICIIYIDLFIPLAYASASFISVSLYPVSYTHLDVYKRQPFTYVKCIFKAFGKLDNYSCPIVYCCLITHK